MWIQARVIMLKVENNLGDLTAPPLPAFLLILSSSAPFSPSSFILLHFILHLLLSSFTRLSSLLHSPQSDQMLAISRLLMYLHFCIHGNAWIFMTPVSRCGASAYIASLFVCVCVFWCGTEPQIPRPLSWGFCPPLCEDMTVYVSTGKDQMKKKKAINILWELKPQGTHILSFLSPNAVYKWIISGELKDVHGMKYQMVEAISMPNW